MACTLCTGVLLPVQLYFKLLVNVLMTGRLLLILRSGDTAYVKRKYRGDRKDSVELTDPELTELEELRVSQCHLSIALSRGQNDRTRTQLRKILNEMEALATAVDTYGYRAVSMVGRELICYHLPLEPVSYTHLTLPTNREV